MAAVTTEGRCQLPILSCFAGVNAITVNRSLIGKTKTDEQDTTPDTRKVERGQAKCSGGEWAARTSHCRGSRSYRRTTDYSAETCMTRERAVDKSRGTDGVTG